MTLTLLSDQASSNTSLPAWCRDNYLAGLPNIGTGLAPVYAGVQLFSLDHSFSYSPGAPASGQTVKNLAGQNDLSIITQAASPNNSALPTWNAAEKSLDFTPVKRGATGIATPAGWLAAQFNDGYQQFLEGIYVLIPSSANWEANNGAVDGFVGDSPANGTWGVMSRLAMVYSTSGGQSIWFNPVNAGGFDYVTTTAAQIAPFQGKWCLLAGYRYGGNSTLYLADVAGANELIVSKSSGTTSTTTISGSAQATFGLDAAASSSSSYSHRIARGFIENLQVTGRNPLSVLRADRARILARGLI